MGLWSLQCVDSGWATRYWTPQKHVPQDAVLALAWYLQNILRESHPSKLPPRCTAMLAQTLKLELVPSDPHNVYVDHMDYFESVGERVANGQLWVPLPIVVMGEEAGLAVMQELLNTCKNEKYYRRSTHTTPSAGGCSLRPPQART